MRVEEEPVLSTEPTPDLVERLASPEGAAVASREAWWRACNHLTIGQIYLHRNALVREPLSRDECTPGRTGTGDQPRAVLCLRPGQPAALLPAGGAARRRRPDGRAGAVGPNRRRIGG